MINRQRLALLVTRLMNGENRLVTVSTAFVLACTSLFCGVFLAQKVKQTPISDSFLYSERRSPKQSVDPAWAVSFFHYLNAMAPAVQNLDIQPHAPFQSFNALYDASQDYHIALQTFGFDLENQEMSVSCMTQEISDTQGFLNQITASEQFSNIVLMPGSDPLNFTITLSFLS
ncbi:MAG: hypothetical protein HFG18_06660 [Oscillospiraceae bacterium]|nr:hypothetical protein [Oscillospiraceae bacterium]MCI9363961.1 hypothetical protein [Oscillospiraceae bacterium]